ncbi:nucleoside-diphosphate-sugar epimerase [Rhodobacter aestuarii]|uniref:Nucleoside-diphosphate-sugar epimerase n=1 Tax=Rhodobacter aestuarii TaxID=453582 RepID=A0A1N7Q5J9_9RHOB|nr:NAD-dependent epimerase/dehydratase family protein [Rhodobacter aestuarii]PTV93898.1 nucleoside-diphosphate-sugar epimerase [Rhodobacter aestuarii]SIT17877.1 Nucleoside-diphosphate-sugar epimerase [Rhodobacter aestuarii]
MSSPNLSASSALPRLLIVGGSGRLGRLLRHAWAGGANEAPQLLWQARAGRAVAESDLIFDPLSEPEAYLSAIAQADVVLNLAGVVRGDAAQLARNTDLALAAVAAAKGKPVLVASSAAVYGRAGAEPCAEESQMMPIAPYGAAKAAMERALLGASGVTVLRIGNVAGADALLGAAPTLEPRQIDIFPAGHGPLRSYIGPQALAGALGHLVRLVATGQPVPPCLNLALVGPVGMEALAEAAGLEWTPRAAPDGAIERVELALERAQALGLVPDHPTTADAIINDLRGLEELGA